MSEVINDETPVEKVRKSTVHVDSVGSMKQDSPKLDLKRMSDFCLNTCTMSKTKKTDA